MVVRVLHPPPFKTGRRVTTAGSGIIAGVTSFLCIPLLLLDQDTMATAFAMLGKASVTVCYTAIYVFSGEIFPTEVRNAGMGTSSCAARISAMAAPFLGAPMVGRVHFCVNDLPCPLFGECMPTVTQHNNMCTG
ncbi:hypothetical protein LSAT2_008011 [Lamellibrachia satsuma]|nr:hypothetical protein LSAT2_008011 [Lamellibrachia satsuma]